MIGVIGGMGPLATADFFSKVIQCTPAEGDDGHVPLLISSDPRIPSRPAALLADGPSPLPVLSAIRDRLLAAGARALVMPCNTAHYWYPELLRDCPVPFPSIVAVGAQAARVRAGAASDGRVGLVATRATLAAGVFERELALQGLKAVHPDDETLDQLILPAIADVKAGRVAESLPKMTQAVERLLDAGAHCVLLACTEAPVALSGASPQLHARTVDTTLELARHTVQLWRELGQPSSPPGP